MGTIFFFLFGISCQQKIYHNQTNIEQPLIVENKIIVENKNHNIPPITKDDDNSKALINKDGWKLPSISLFTKQSEKTLQIKKNKSQIKIKQIEYQPNEDVIQIADGNTAKYASRIPDIEDKSWLIRYMKVFSVKEKTFCYLMRGDWVITDQNGKIKARAAMTIVLVYIDTDGDGVFETFRYGSSELPPIPEWVAKMYLTE